MSRPRTTTPTTVVFDLGGVLIDWDPRYLYRQLLPEDEVEPFLDEIGFAAVEPRPGRRRQLGRRGRASSRPRHPHRRDLIAAYPARFRGDDERPGAGHRRAAPRAARRAAPGCWP